MAKKARVRPSWKKKTSAKVVKRQKELDRRFLKMLLETI